MHFGEEQPKRVSVISSRMKPVLELSLFFFLGKADSHSEVSDTVPGGGARQATKSL